MKNKIILLLVFNLVIALMSVAILAQSASEQNSQSRIIEGQIEITHADDFKNPENSKYIYYLRTNTNRYELNSEKGIPPISPGTSVRIKGIIEGNSIQVDALKVLKSPEDEITHDNSFFIPPVPLKKNSSKNLFNLDWIYFAAPLVLVGTLLASHELHRKKRIRALADERNMHRIVTLRRWASSNLRKGYTLTQMKSSLIKHNYNVREIDEAFKGLV